MKTITEFSLDDIGQAAPDAPVVPVRDSAISDVAALEKWAGDQMAIKPSTAAIIYDIETGPRPEHELRKLFREKTPEEFSATCDKRWKTETVAAKYEEYKVSAWQEFIERAALSPGTGRVLLIGLLVDGEYRQLADESETATLTVFWDLVDQTLIAKRPLIGHNSNAFDLPFLVRRSWCLGVRVPYDVRHGRYWNPLFRDTMERWTCGAKEYISLNTLAGFFGCGHKIDGVSGADFAGLWFGSAEDHAKAIAYNEQDLRLAAAIAAKMGMV